MTLYEQILEMFHEDDRAGNGRIALIGETEHRTLADAILILGK